MSQPSFSKRKSVTVFACLILFILNLALSQIYQWRRALETHSVVHQNAWITAVTSCFRFLKLWDESSIDTTVFDFNALRKPADLVVMGSSVMMYPIWSVDQLTDRSIPHKMWLYHQARVLERQLQKRGLKDETAYD